MRHIKTQCCQQQPSARSVAACCASNNKRSPHINRRQLFGVAISTFAASQAPSNAADLKNIVDPSFRAWDENGDGVMSVSELQRAYNKVLGLDLSPQDIKRNVAPALDFDDSQEVSTDEWMRSMSLEAPVDAQWMSVVDENGDGFVSVQELENALGGTGGEAGKIIERVAFKQADVSPRDGRLSQTEAQSVMDLISAGMQDGVRTAMQRKMAPQ